MHMYTLFKLSYISATHSFLSSFSNRYSLIVFGPVHSYSWIIIALFFRLNNARVYELLLHKSSACFSFLASHVYARLFREENTYSTSMLESSRTLHDVYLRTCLRGCRSHQEAARWGKGFRPRRCGTIVRRSANEEGRRGGGWGSEREALLFQEDRRSERESSERRYANV